MRAIMQDPTVPVTSSPTSESKSFGELNNVNLVLSPEQKLALETLRSGENVFLTGGAGVGKSTVIKELIEELNPKEMPVLASTGAAAVLMGGRTFHSFFGIGIMEGGPAATFDRASKNKKLLKRLKSVEGVIIDEISMIPGQALEVAERLSCLARGSSLPWGGLRVIVVGDFAQLPPVQRAGGPKDWSFLSSSWQKTQFIKIELNMNQRVREGDFISVLNQIRRGIIDPNVIDFLNSHTKPHDEDSSGTRLFPRREQSDQFNTKKLNEINDAEVVFDSIYLGEEKDVEALKRTVPIPEKLILKIGCEILFLKNDLQRRWVNGTRGTVVAIETDHLKVEKRNGREVKVEKGQFSLTDADGNIKAGVIQFPVALAYATTIHKSQGATLDELWCDLGSLWEPGQGYVALSRLRESQGLHILRWSPSSFKTDPQVARFCGWS
jgi:ATP-dependent DNA helicase PIF1